MVWTTGPTSMQPGSPGGDGVPSVAKSALAGSTSCAPGTRENTMVAPGALPGTPGAVASPKRGKRPGPITSRRTPAGGRRRLPRQSLTVVSYEGKVLGLLVRPLPAHRSPRLVPTGRQSCATLPSRGSLPLHAHSPQSPRPPHTGEPSPSVPRLAPLPTHRRVAPAPVLPSRHVRAAPVSAPRALPRCRLPAHCHGVGSPRIPTVSPPLTRPHSPRSTSPPCPRDASGRPAPQSWGEPNYSAPPIQQYVPQSQSQRCPPKSRSPGHAG